jgi:hypothetical protein
VKVLLISTGRLPASYFVRVRREMEEPGAVIDVLAWSPPRDLVSAVVRRYVLFGPGRMPPSQPDAHGRQYQRHVQATLDPHVATARRTWNLGRIAAGVRRRIRRLVRAPRIVALRRKYTRGPSRQFWRRVRTNELADQLAREADLLVVLDGGALRTGWHLARRNPDKPALFGLPAAAQFAKSDRLASTGGSH